MFLFSYMTLNISVCFFQLTSLRIKLIQRNWLDRVQRDLSIVLCTNLARPHLQAFQKFLPVWMTTRRSLLPHNRIKPWLRHRVHLQNEITFMILIILVATLPLSVRTFSELSSHSSSWSSNGLESLLLLGFFPLL